MKILNMVIPILMHFLTFIHKAQHFALNWSFVSNVKKLHQPITSDVTYDFGAATAHRRIYWLKFLTLSIQTSRYIRKYIRIMNNKTFEFHSKQNPSYFV